MLIDHHSGLRWPVCLYLPPAAIHLLLPFVPHEAMSIAQRNSPLPSDGLLEILHITFTGKKSLAERSAFVDTMRLNDQIR